MSYEALAMLCLIAALVLLVAECFLPTGGIVGILSLLSFVVSVWAAKQAWYGVRPGIWYTYLLCLVVLIPGSLYGLFRYLQNSDYGQRIFLAGPQSEDVTPYSEETRHLDDLLGAVGTAVTDLMPTGICRVDGERMDCVAENGMVMAGVQVTVIGRRGVSTLVRPATAEELDPQRPIETSLSDSTGDIDREDFGTDDLGEPPVEDPFA